MASSYKVSLKLFIDKKNNRVLFAEAGKQFIDFLFNILALPVGTFIPLLNQAMVGSMGIIYESIKNLCPTYLQPNVYKDSLLKPTVYITSGYFGLSVHLPNVKPKNFYSCRSARGSGYSCQHYVADDKRTICPSCLNTMERCLGFVEPSIQKRESFSSEGGYVKGLVTYMVMDDLAVKPLSTISITTQLNKFNVKDIGALEEKVVDLGMDEGVKLLKASLLSKSVLTDVFIPMLEKGVKQEVETTK